MLQINQGLNNDHNIPEILASARQFLMHADHRLITLVITKYWRFTPNSRGAYIALQNSEPCIGIGWRYLGVRSFIHPGYSTCYVVIQRSGG